MSRLIKWVLGIVAILVVLMVAAVVLVPMLVDVQQYKPKLEELVTQQTGRSFTMGNDMDVSIFPWVGVRLSDVRLGNPEGFTAKDMVAVDQFEVRLKVMPLLSRRIEISTFAMNAPQIFLERRKDGLANWEGLGKTDARDGEKKPAAEKSESKDSGLPIESLMVEDFTISRGQVVFSDKAAGLEKQITDLNLTLGNISLDKPVQVDFTAQVDEKPVSLNGNIGPMGNNPGKSDIDFDLVLKALGVMDVTLAGKLLDPSNDPRVDMDLDVASFSLRKFMAELKQPFFMETADPSVFEKMALRTHIAGNASAVSLTSGQMTLDDTSLTFNGAAKAFDKPDVTFDLVLDRIDLDRYLPPAQETPEAGSPSSDEKKAAASGSSPDYGPLRKLVLDGKLKIGQMKASNMTVSDVVARITAENGQMALDPFSLNLYQGSLASTLGVDVRKKSPVTRINLDLNGIQAGPLIRDAVEKDLISGTLTGEAVLTMAGDTADQIKKTLDGNGKMTFTDGAIEGIDIAGMVRNAAAKAGLGQPVAEKPRTDFAELTFPFSVGQGIFNIMDAGLKSPLLRVKAGGQAYLLKEELDIRVEPKLVGTLKGQGDTADRSGIMVPLRVTGPFASPKIRPDLAGLLGGGLPDKEKIKELIDTKKLPATDTKSLEEEGKKVLKGLLPGLQN
ncbi:MAG: AsmA family protein [Desulfotignum sp.]|nr:AsmA family protein [Desulfotignum sp.]MCF8087811.1 AsmA family protein [Desulfotignum sp.]MCF8137799.1 AsmA family protein [Desulfotignum sp.]